MKTLFAIAFITLATIGFGQNVEEKQYVLDEAIKSLNIAGFDEIHFEFADCNQIDISYPKISGNTSFSYTNTDRNIISCKLKQNAKEASKIVIRGDLHHIKSVKIKGTNNSHVYFPEGFDEQSLIHWESKNGVSFIRQ